MKAVEYWIKSKFEARPELLSAAEFVHFACTSEDINNTSHALQIQAARDVVVLPAIDGLITKLRDMAHQFADVSMLARTHGQTASPTTVGKEIANVAVRLAKAREQIAKVDLLGKMNGAVGNYNAHMAAWPDFDWEAFSRKVAGLAIRLAMEKAAPCIGHTSSPAAFSRPNFNGPPLCGHALGTR